MSTTPDSILTTEAQIVKELYVAINSNDIPTTMGFFDPQIERIEPEGFPGQRAFKGIEEVRAHFTKARNTWAEGSCEPEHFIVNGDKVVALVHVKVRLKDKTEWNEGRIGDGFAFKNGKITMMQTFIDRNEALKWAGIQ